MCRVWERWNTECYGDAWWGNLTCPGDQGRVPWEVTLRLKPDRCVGGWEVGCGGGHGTPEARKNSCSSQYCGSGSQNFRAKRNFRHNLDLWLGSEPWIHTGVIWRAVKNPDARLRTWVINSYLWGGHTGISVCTELSCWLQCAAKVENCSFGAWLLNNYQFLLLSMW